MSRNISELPNQTQKEVIACAMFRLLAFRAMLINNISRNFYFDRTWFKIKYDESDS